MQELMSRERAWAAWKARDKTWEPTFDLRGGSPWVDALERYLRRDK